MGYKGSRSDKGFMVMVGLVHSIGGAGGVVEYVGLHQCCVICKMWSLGVGSRFTICMWYQGRSCCGTLFVALERGPRGYMHGQCLPVGGQQLKEHPSCGVSGRGCIWGKGWFFIGS